MRLKHILAVVLCAMPSLAWGQGAILQGGPYAAGRAPMYTRSGTSQAVVQDSGPAGGGAVGLGLAEILLVARGTGAAPYAGQGTGPYGTVDCRYDAPITNSTGYHYLCFSANAQGGALIATGAVGSASPQPLNMIINGTTYSFPFALSGVVGPATTTVGAAAIWANTTGTLLGEASYPRQGLTQAKTIHVDSSQGSNVEFCGATTGAAACATIQFATAQACNRYDIGGHSITIKIDNVATYSEQVTLCQYVSLGSQGQATMVIQGASSQSSSCTNYPTVSGTRTFTAVGIAPPWTLKNLQINGQNTADAGAWLAMDGVCFGATAGPHVSAVNSGSKVEFINNPYTINGNATGGHIQALLNGEVLYQSAASPVTLTGSPSFGGTFATVNYSSSLLCQDITFTGATAALTSRYLIDQSSGILCGQTGVTANPNAVLPGTTDGTGLATTADQVLISNTLGVAPAWVPANQIKTIKPIFGGSGTTNITPGSVQFTGLSSISATETNYLIAPFSATLRAFYANVTTAPGVGEAVAFEFRVGGIATSVGCTISDANLSCSDTTNTASITASTALGVKVTSTGGAAASHVSWGANAQ